MKCRNRFVLGRWRVAFRTVGRVVFGCDRGRETCVCTMKGVNKHIRTWAAAVYPRVRASVSTTFRPASLRCVYRALYYYYVWSSGPSIVFSDIPPRIIHDLWSCWSCYCWYLSFTVLKQTACADL